MWPCLLQNQNPLSAGRKAQQAETGSGGRKGQGRGRAMERTWGFPAVALSVHLRDRSCADSVHGTRLLNCDAAPVDAGGQNLPLPLFHSTAW